MTEDLFEAVIEYPNDWSGKEYDALVGLDDIKESLNEEAGLMLKPELVSQWSKKLYNRDIALTGVFLTRPPLFLFSGDVGTGKTALAESFAGRVTKEHGLTVYLYKLSLNARGSGMVGEMTKLIAKAFEEIAAEAEKRKNGKSALVLMIDEADALAQSREATQMHHEDRAGVNALIRGIDSLKRLPTPVIVIMCTNRPDSIDPAVRRRAVQQYDFSRPTYDNCLKLVSGYLSDIGIGADQLEDIAKKCTTYNTLKYGYTYSDIVQRLLPVCVITAVPDKPVTYELVIDCIDKVRPTPQFKIT